MTDTSKGMELPPGHRTAIGVRGVGWQAWKEGGEHFYFSSLEDAERWCWASFGKSDQFTAMKAKAERCEEAEAMLRARGERVQKMEMLERTVSLYDIEHAAEVRAYANDLESRLRELERISKESSERLRARVDELEGRVWELSMDLSNAECDTQEAIANAIDSERDMASEQAPGDWLPNDPHEAYVEGMSQAFVTARDWSYFDAGRQQETK